MLVQSVNNANSTQFGNNKAKHKESNSGVIAASGLLTGATMAGGTYLFFPSSIDAAHTLGLKSDKFEKLFKDVSPEVKTAIQSSKDSFDKLTENVEESLKAHGFSENEVDTQEFLTKILGDETVTKDNLKEKIDELSKSVEAKVKAKDAASQITPEEMRLGLFQRVQNAINGAKDGKLSKENIKAFLTKENEIDILAKTKSELEKLGEKLPKIKSLKKAAIFGVISAVVASIITAVTMPKEN